MFSRKILKSASQAEWTTISENLSITLFSWKSCTNILSEAQKSASSTHIETADPHEHHCMYGGRKNQLTAHIETPMPQPILTRLTVIDLVPFGNAGSKTEFYALRLTPPEWERWLPGQFIMLRPADASPEYLWGRPFSICQVTPTDMLVFFQIRGRATAVMAKLTPGDVLDVWGPLGNSFAVEAALPTLLLAGGIGIVPFVGYVQSHPAPWKLRMEFGHRMPLECYPIDGITEYIPIETHQEKVPDDRRIFLEYMDKRIEEYAENGLVLACGPTPFLHAVQSLALKHKARAQLSLETRMACGVGACLGCVVKTPPPQDETTSLAAHSMEDMRSASRNVQTCTCGPVFWADSVIL
jgi:dihydroorotate dehydrogenase electron transfer subunit